MLPFQRVLVVLLSFMFVAQSADSQVVINELDPSGPGIDNMEFVELYGSPNEDLAGYIVVVFNGSNTQSNNVLDLRAIRWTRADSFSLVGRIYQKRILWLIKQIGFK